MKIAVIGAGAVAKTSAAAVGVAVTVAATAPATTSGLMRANFADMRIGYHIDTCTKPAPVRWMTKGTAK